MCSFYIFIDRCDIFENKRIKRLNFEIIFGWTNISLTNDLNSFVIYFDFLFGV